MTGIFTPVRLSITWSESWNVLPRLRASIFPTEVLPAPIMPTRKIFSGTEPP